MLIQISLTFCTTVFKTKVCSSTWASGVIFIRKSLRPGRTTERDWFWFHHLPFLFKYLYLQLPSCRNCPGMEALFLYSFLFMLMLVLFSSSHGFDLITTDSDILLVDTALGLRAEATFWSTLSSVDRLFSCIIKAGSIFCLVSSSDGSGSSLFT